MHPAPHPEGPKGPSPPARTRAHRRAPCLLQGDRRRRAEPREGARLPARLGAAVRAQCGHRGHAHQSQRSHCFHPGARHVQHVLGPVTGGGQPAGRFRGLRVRIPPRPRLFLTRFRCLVRQVTAAIVTVIIPHFTALFLLYHSAHQSARTVRGREHTYLSACWVGRQRATQRTGVETVAYHAPGRAKPCNCQSQL